MTIKIEVENSLNRQKNHHFFLRSVRAILRKKKTVTKTINKISRPSNKYNTSIIVIKKRPWDLALIYNGK